MPNGSYDKEWNQKEFQRLDLRMDRELSHLNKQFDKESRHLHNRIDEVWGEYGMRAVWHRLDSVEKKLWLVIIGLVGNMGGVMAVLIKMALL